MASNRLAVHSMRATAFAAGLLLTSAALPVWAQAGAGGAVAGPAQPSGLEGSWTSPETEDIQERLDGPVLANWAGIPLAEGAKARAQSYSASSLEEPENVCHFYTQWHFADTIYPLGITTIVGGPTNEILAWKIEPKEDIPPMTIWMDGNQPPPPSKFEDHHRAAYTVGHWEGNTLVAYTTNMKTEMARRNGAFVSDEATMTSYFILHDSTHMTAAFILQDPIDLTQPYIYSRTYERTIGGANSFSYPPCIPTYEGTAEGTVVFHLPGQNGDLDFPMRLFHMPLYASEGGAETMYPAFRDKLKDEYLKLYHTFSKDCPMYCRTTGSFFGQSDARHRSPGSTSAPSNIEHPAAKSGG